MGEGDKVNRCGSGGSFCVVQSPRANAQQTFAGETFILQLYHLQLLSQPKVCFVPNCSVWVSSESKHGEIWDQISFWLWLETFRGTSSVVKMQQKTSYCNFSVWHLILQSPQCSDRKRGAALKLTYQSIGQICTLIFIFTHIYEMSKNFYNGIGRVLWQQVKISSKVYLQTLLFFH